MEAGAGPRQEKRPEVKDNNGLKICFCRIIYHCQRHLVAFDASVAIE